MNRCGEAHVNRSTPVLVQGPTQHSSVWPNIMVEIAIHPAADGRVTHPVRHWCKANLCLPNHCSNPYEDIVGKLWTYNSSIIITPDSTCFLDIVPMAGRTLPKIKFAAQLISISDQRRGKDNAKQLPLWSQLSALCRNRRQIHSITWPKCGLLGTLL